MQEEPGRTVDQPLARPLSRRRFLLISGGTSSLLLLTACGGGATAPAKPTEAAPAAAPAKPAVEPTKPAAAAPEATKPAAPAQAAPASASSALTNLKGVTISALYSSSFVPDADPFFKKQVEDGFMKETGAQVNLEFVGNNDVQPKIAASIQSGSGPDILQLQHNWAHLYQDSLVDMSDVAEDVKKITGPFFPLPEAYSNVKGKYLAVPHDIIGTAIHWRKTQFKEIGVEKFPATIEEMHAVGKKLKANGHPLGQSLGHSTGDPVFWVYPLIWAYGGQEVDSNGKVVINSPGTIAAVAEMKKAWKESYDETGVAWDDSSNNRAFLAETISATQNGASIWWVAKQQKSPFLDDIGLDFLPAGPKGQVVMASSNYYAIPKYSPNAAAAKAFTRWVMTEPIWMPWFELCASYYSGVGPKQNDNPIWEKFPPVTRIFQKSSPIARPIGYPGAADQKASLTVSKYILVDMFARAVQGDSPEAAVAWAEGEMKSIYGG